MRVPESLWIYKRQDSFGDDARCTGKQSGARGYYPGGAYFWEHWGRGRIELCALG